jgi:hypothetical protein
MGCIVTCYRKLSPPAARERSRTPAVAAAFAVQPPQPMHASDGGQGSTQEGSLKEKIQNRKQRSHFSPIHSSTGVWTYETT